MVKKTKEEALPENLEGALKALEEIVEKLEEPELPLEESIQLFERGTALSQVCRTRLTEAEKKVEILMKKVPQASSREDFEVTEFEPGENV